MRPDLDTIRTLLLAFWALWYTVVFATNLADALLAAGVLPHGWAFASGNHAFMVEVTARYGTPGGLVAALFAGVIVWQLLAAILFWRAAAAHRSAPRLATPLYAAFGAGIALWCAFVLADEVFIAYEVAGTHLRLLVAHLATLLLFLVPRPPA